MLTQKQMFGFGMLIKDILSICAYDPVHVFWKDEKVRFLGYNDMQGQLLQQKNGYSNFIGKYMQEISPGREGGMLADNDTETIKNANVKCFIEKLYNRECLSFKSQLKNSANTVIGTMGIAFYFNEISLARTASILSRLHFNPQQSNSAILLSFNVSNKFSLSKREKECVHYIVRGMSAREIGRELKISNRTVESHIASIKDKLDCYSRSQIISKILGETQ